MKIVLIVIGIGILIAAAPAIVALLLRWFSPTKKERDERAQEKGMGTGSAKPNSNQYWGEVEKIGLLVAVLATILFNILLSQFDFGIWKALWNKQVLFWFFNLTVVVAFMARVYSKRPELRMLGTVVWVLVLTLFIGAISTWWDYRKAVKRLETSRQPPAQVVTQTLVPISKSPVIEFQLKAGEWSPWIERSKVPWIQRAYWEFSSPIKAMVNYETTPRESVINERGERKLIINDVIIDRIKFQFEEGGTVRLRPK